MATTLQMLLIRALPGLQVL